MFDYIYFDVRKKILLGYAMIWKILKKNILIIFNPKNLKA